MDIIGSFLFDFGVVFCVAVCWGVLFGSPLRVLFVIGLLGGFGHSVRFLLLEMDFGIISATLSASVLVGLIGVFVAHYLHNPPVVLTMPACITMIPGLYAYRSMLGTIKLSEPSILRSDVNIIPNIAHNVVLTFSLLFTLAIGISISALLFRNKSVKEIFFNKKSIDTKIEE